MIDYMEHVLRAFEQCTNWNRDNSYENITATSENLLHFRIPSALKFQVSNRSTSHTFTTFELSNSKIINGSLAYLYTNCQDIDSFIKGSPGVSLHTCTETFRRIKPYYHYHLQPSPNGDFNKSSLYYGRMYYPNSNLEAMIVKRVSPYTQFVLKCISSLSSPSILTLYWQRDSGRNCQEWIMSSNETLIGYRVLHNFIGSQAKLDGSLYNNSSLSLGGELWFSVLNTSPACSTTLRYCTHSANTGKPLTLTLSWNPLFGHVSSTYSVKTSSGTTFCSKYDFNLYSIESNLSFGCEFWTRGKDYQREKSEENEYDVPILNSSGSLKDLSFDSYSKAPEIAMYYHLSPPPDTDSLPLGDTNIKVPVPPKDVTERKPILERFESSLDTNNFTSVWKLSTSLRDKSLRVLWEGKYKGFLVSAGTEFAGSPTALPSNLVQLSNPKTVFQPTKIGLQLQYSI